jgi:hypothetical protein
MPSTSTPQVSAKARRARHHPAAHGLARFGLAARGVLYLLIGVLAILVAFGHSAHEADQQGALQLLAGKSYGVVLLWLLGIGFAAYALWRLSEAVFGVAGEGGGALSRVKSVARAVGYGFFAYLTFKVLFGHEGSQAQRQRDLTAKVMHHTGGRWAVGIAGAVIVIFGLALVAEGIRRKFLQYMDLSPLSRRARRVVESLGVAGITARGLVFALIGGLVIDAAVSHKPSESGGLDKALLTLRGQPFGEVLLILAALGLIAFGAYGLCEARWHKI